MKQSIYLILMQIISVFLTALSTVYVAIKIPASAYAIIAINAIITSIIVVFSNTGIETIGLRNFLFLKKINKNQQIKMISTQALILRLIASLMASVLIIPYVWYLSVYKFDNNNLGFFVLFIFSGVVMSLNDCMGLLLKAHNKFIQSVFSLYIVTVFGKVLALFMFLKFGLDSYLYTLSLLPVFAFIYLIIITRSHYKIKYLYSIKLIKSTLIKSKHFAFSSYVSFLINNFDHFIISIFMPVEFIGVFGLLKQVKSFTTSFVSNFFDPLLQKSVLFKGHFEKMKDHLIKLYKLRNIAVIFSSFVLIIFYFKGNFFIEKVGLTHYPYLFEGILFYGLSIVILITYKIPYYLIATFIKPKDYFIYNIFVSVASILSFLILILFFDNGHLFVYFAFSNLIILFISKYTLKAKGGLANIVNNSGS